jgi:hypothetical protein
MMTTISQQDILRKTYCFEYASCDALELLREMKRAVRFLFAEAREGLASCATVDEATAFREKAEELRVACRQAGAHALEKCAEAIKLMTLRRIGELSKELETAPGKRTDEPLPQGEATQAAIRAGYSAKTARQIGEEKLSR